MSNLNRKRRKKKSIIMTKKKVKKKGKSMGLKGRSKLEVKMILTFEKC